MSLLKRFEIDKPLTNGAFGQVYTCFDKYNDFKL